MSCCCPGWARSRKLLVLTGKAEGKELFVRAHLAHLVPGCAGVRCPVRPRSLPRSLSPQARLRTFSPDASKFSLSGGNSGRRLDNDLPSPRGADPPLAEMEGKLLLPSFILSRSPPSPFPFPGVFWHGGRGRWQGQLQQWGAWLLQTPAPLPHPHSRVPAALADGNLQG